MMNPEDQLLNCEMCLKDKHSECRRPESCLCSVESNHNAPAYSVKEGVIPTVEQLKQSLRDVPVTYDRHLESTVSNVASTLINKYHFITNRESGDVYYHTGQKYDCKNTKSIIFEETEKRIINCRDLDRIEVYKKIKAHTYRNQEEFDSDPYLLSLQNNILDLRTMQPKPHTHEYITKITYPVNYVEPEFEIHDETIFEDIERNLKDTLFWKALKASFTVDGKFQREKLNSVLEMIASVFVRKPIEEKSFINLGTGNNGKSVFLDYIENLVGRENLVEITLQQLSEDKFASSKLDGKVANISNDIDPQELKKTNVFKILSSGQGYFVQGKGKDGYTLYPTAKLIFSTNKFPKIYRPDEGFFRRWYIIKWERKFGKGKSENIPNLKTLLKENQIEKDKVFSCIIHLAKILLVNETFFYSKDWKVVKKEWIESADPISDFVENRTKYSEGSKTKRETYQLYKEFCFEKGDAPLGMVQFSRVFSEYYEESKNNGMRIWLNIDFKKPQQETLKESDES